MSSEIESSGGMENVKRSLASLEAVRVKSIHSECLSSDETQSAKSDLNDIIRTAESIKEHLHSSENDDDNGECSSSDDDGIRTEQKTLPAAKLPEERRRSTAATINSSEAPKRRLSTPCCIPFQSSETETQVSKV